MTMGPDTFGGAPRRRVPWLLRGAAWCRGFHTQLGWLIVGLGAALVWITTPWSDLHDFRGALETAGGQVAQRVETHVFHPGAATYAYRYSFVTADGGAYGGWCYGNRESVEPGDAVTVEFSAGRPEVSRIRGMRRGLLREQHYTTYLVFAAGLVFVAIGMIRGLGAVRLLVLGKAAEGVLKSRDRTGKTAEKAAEIVLPRFPILYTLTVEYQAEDGQTHEAVCRTYRPQDLVPPARPQVLYDPNRRRGPALVLQGMPGAPRMAEGGRLAVTSRARAAAYLVIPALVAGAMGAYAWWRYLGGPT